MLRPPGCVRLGSPWNGSSRATRVWTATAGNPATTTRRPPSTSERNSSSTSSGSCSSTRVSPCESPRNSFRPNRETAVMQVQEGFRALGRRRWVVIGLQLAAVAVLFGALGYAFQDAWGEAKPRLLDADLSELAISLS